MESINNIEKFRECLVDVINTSNVSLGVGYYVVKDVYNDIKSLYLQALYEEGEAAEEEEFVEATITPEIKSEKELMENE